MTGADDEDVDGAALYTVTVAVAASDDTGYAGLAPMLVSVVNRDNDIPGIEIAAEDDAGTSEAGAVAVLSVVLTAKPSAEVTVQLATDETEGQLLANSLLFTQSNWNIPQLVTVAGVDDIVVDGDVVYNIVATAASSDPNYDGLAAAAFSLVNAENDSGSYRVGGQHLAL